MRGKMRIRKRYASCWFDGARPVWTAFTRIVGSVQPFNRGERPHTSRLSGDEPRARALTGSVVTKRIRRPYSKSVLAQNSRI